MANKSLIIHSKPKRKTDKSVTQILHELRYGPGSVEK